ALKPVYTAPRSEQPHHCTLQLRIYATLSGISWWRDIVGRDLDRDRLAAMTPLHVSGNLGGDLGCREHATHLAAIHVMQDLPYCSIFGRLCVEPNLPLIDARLDLDQYAVTTGVLDDHVDPITGRHSERQLEGRRCPRA